MESVVEVAQLIDRIRVSQTRLINWESDASEFIALFGSYDAGYQGAVNLDEQVNQFLTSDTLAVQLLVGHSGAGKTLYTRGLINRLWANYREGDPIPLWISLPNCKKPDERVIEQALMKCDLDEAQIEQLKSIARWTIVFDAYDEVRLTKNLHHCNNVGNWNAKSIFTCRHEYLYSLDNFKSLFAPFDNGQPNYSKATVLYVKPFIPSQISDYVKQYILTHDAEWTTLEVYLKVFEDIPGMMELIKTPYLLKLAVESAPLIVKQFSEEKSEKKQDLTRSALMDVFFVQWFSRQEEKLKVVGAISQDEEIQPEFWRYGRELAQLMHEKQVTQVEYDPQEENLFDEETEKNPFSSYFDMTIPRVALLQTACFIRKVGPFHYAFAHGILADYYLTRGLYDAVLGNKDEIDKTQETIKQNISKKNTKNEKDKKSKKSTDYFNAQLISNEDQVVQLHADRVINDKSYKEKMFEYLYSSRKNKSNMIQSSNALSILVKAGVSFNGADLSGLYLYGANFSGGYFDSASFKGTDLATARLARGWFRNADFTSSNVAGVDFGEYPWFEHDDPVYCVHYNPDLKRLVVGAGEKIIIWDLVVCQKIKVLIGHKDSVTNVILTPDGKFLFSGGLDGKVMVWDLSYDIFKSIGDFEIVYRLFFAPESNSLIVGALQQLPNNESRSSRAMSRTGIGDGIFPVRDVVEVMFSNKEEGFFGSWENSTRYNSSSELDAFNLDRISKACFLSKIVGVSENGSAVYFTQDGKLQVWQVKKNEIKVLEYNEKYKQDRWKGQNVERVRLDSCKGIKVDDGYIKSLRKEELPLNNGMFVTKNGQFAVIYESQSIATYRKVGSEHIEEINGHTAPITSAYMSEDGLTVLTGSEDNSVRVWDVVNNKGNPLFWHCAPVTCVELSADGNNLISGSIDKRVYIKDFRLFHSLKNIRNAIKCVKISKNGKFIAATYNDGICRIWNFERQVVLRNILDIKKSKLKHLDFLFISDDGTKAIMEVECSNDDRYTLALNLNNIEDINKKSQHRTCTALCATGDGNVVITGHLLDGLRIHDLVNFEKYTELKMYEGVKTIDTSTDGSIIVFSWGIFIKCINKNEKDHTLKGHKKDVIYVKLCSDLNTIFSISEDKTLIKWDCRKNKVLDVWKCENVFKNASISDDGIILICLESQTSVQIWNINTKSQISTITIIAGVKSISTDSLISLILVGLDDGSVQLWQSINEARTSWQLTWSSESDHPNISTNLSGSNFTHAKGLTKVNQLLAVQQGAIVENGQSKISSVAKRTGSPVYHKLDDTSPVKDQKCVIF